MTPVSSIRHQGGRQQQDVQTTSAGTAELRQGVAKDRHISIEDAQMLHRRKSRSVRVDGYKRHVLRDLDTGLVRDVGITPANVAEATVTEALSADLRAQQVTVGELHHALAHIGHWQGRRARYRGLRKNFV
jgi:Transposase DDE domain